METKVKYKLNREKKMLFLQSTNITMPEIALGARDKMGPETMGVGVKNLTD